MTHKTDENPRKTRHVVVKVVIFFLIFIALYLAGFVVAVKLGPGLSPPISTVLSVVYWPLIKCDENNIEPFNSIIECLRHGPKPVGYWPLRENADDKTRHARHGQNHGSPEFIAGTPDAL